MPFLFTRFEVFVFSRNISTSVQMILRCVGKERDAADVATWNRGPWQRWSRGLGSSSRSPSKKIPSCYFTRMEVLAMMSLEIGAEAVEPAGGCVGHMGHTRPAHKVPPRTNRQLQRAKFTHIILFINSNQSFIHSNQIWFSNRGVLGSSCPWLVL